MKEFCNTVFFLILIICVMFGNLSFVSNPSSYDNNNRDKYSQIIDIRYTPTDSTSCSVGYTDAGSWMGFTIPAENISKSGFCGPFSIYNRYFMAENAVSVSFNGNNAAMVIDSTHYIPGECFMCNSSSLGKIEQKLWFIDSNTALLEVYEAYGKVLKFTGIGWDKNVELSKDENRVWAHHTSGERLALTFEPNIQLELNNNNYEALKPLGNRKSYITISFMANEDDSIKVVQNSNLIIKNPHQYILHHDQRWDIYLSKVLRKNMPEEYNQIAVKSIMTLISNWRSQRGCILHDGIMPCYASDCSIASSDWDNWRFSAALASFAPELAKNNIRSMFDNQHSNGMIVDRINTELSENINIDSKSPLACWAVNEIYEKTGDLDFVREMFCKLKSYHQWLKTQDYNNSNISGSISADKAVKGSSTFGVDKKSLDINAILALENRLLNKLASLIGAEFETPYHSDITANYLFDEERGTFFDKRVNSESNSAEDCKSYIPLWTGTACKEQVEKMISFHNDVNKFSSFIPINNRPANKNKSISTGYLRELIILKHSYSAIKGLRNYGYDYEADQYTKQVFEQQESLIAMAPIQDNYITHSGKRINAPYLSGDAAHLLMMYSDLGI